MSSTLGKHNARLKDLRKAIASNSLTTDNLLPIEGPVLLNETHRTGSEIVELFLEKDTIYNPPGNPKTYTLLPEVFRSIQTTQHSQGVIGLVNPPIFKIDEVLKKSPQLIIVLCRLQNPGNVGAILRSAEAFGATGCIATNGTVSPYNSKLLRASSGSLFRLPHCWGEELTTIEARLQSSNIHLVGTTPTDSNLIGSYSWEKPTAILFGNEGEGLSEKERDFCDEIVRIPHTRTVESLNAAVAAGIVLYEAARCRSINMKENGFTL